MSAISEGNIKWETWGRWKQSSCPQSSNRAAALISYLHVGRGTKWCFLSKCSWSVRYRHGWGLDGNMELFDWGCKTQKPWGTKAILFIYALTCIYWLQATFFSTSFLCPVPILSFLSWYMKAQSFIPSVWMILLMSSFWSIGARMIFRLFV